MMVPTLTGSRLRPYKPSTGFAVCWLSIERNTTTAVTFWFAGQNPELSARWSAQNAENADPWPLDATAAQDLGQPFGVAGQIFSSSPMQTSWTGVCRL